MNASGISRLKREHPEVLWNSMWSRRRRGPVGHRRRDHVATSPPCSVRESRSIDPAGLTVAEVKKAFQLRHARVSRPWIAEPGLWLQFGFGDGPRSAVWRDRTGAGVNGCENFLRVAELATRS